MTQRKRTACAITVEPDGNGGGGRLAYYCISNTYQCDYQEAPITGSRYTCFHETNRYDGGDNVCMSRRCQRAALRFARRAIEEAK
jgi:hypothetical protein